MSTSKLQRRTSEQLYKRFGKYGLVENTRPRWLVSSKGERLELDFFIDKLSVAVEVQGKQHIRFTPFFHATEHVFAEQLRRDREKRDLCDKIGIRLLYIYCKQDIFNCIAAIYQMLEPSKTDTWAFPEKSMQRLFVRDHRQQKNDNNKKKSKAKKRQKKKRRKVQIVEQLPGSRTVRNKGRKLTAVQIRQGQYVVWGGESAHIVSFADETNIKSYVCDCGGQEGAIDNVCSHVWAVFSL